MRLSAFLLSLTLLVSGSVTLTATTASALPPNADDEAMLRRVEKQLQESCHSPTRLVLDWAALDKTSAPPDCDEVHVSVPRMCHNFAETVAALCRDTTPSSRNGPFMLATLGKLTELRCTIDTPHEALARKWLAEHPDTSGSKCPRDAAWNDQMKFEVFKDQGERRGTLTYPPHGTLSLSGTTMIFAYTFERREDDRSFLERELKRLAGGAAPSEQGLSDERPSASHDRTRARVLQDVVLFEVRERYPDLPNQLRRSQHALVTGPPKLLVFTLGGKELAKETLDEEGNVNRVTGTIPDGPARKYFETGSSTKPTVEIEILYQNNQRTKYSSRVENGAYLDGKRDGVWTLPRDLTEQVWERGVLKQVKTHWISDAEEKRPQGQLSTEQSYKNGRPGKLKYYDYSGQVISAKAWALLDDPLLRKPQGRVVNKNGAPNLDKCRAPTDCRSGNCYFKTETARIGQCLAQPGHRPDRGPGHDCNKDTECLSGFCTSRLCE